ncbi:rod shape-determining protein MreC [Gudongella sp. DL1XJH-153]|uniref:rod shape-determining protein MreC n=1 Tax=Gudongella sp. DL1XJH-153 TaxID=3409804 RepID=UPI003BB6D130
MYFLRKYKERMIVIFIAIILLIVIGQTSKERVTITGIERFTGNLLSPLTNGVTFAREKATGFFSSIEDVFDAKSENELLRDEIKKLESENLDLINIIGKTDYLRNELELSKSTELNLIKGQVIGKEPGNWFDRFVIDIGTDDGIVKGATVIQGVEVEQNLYQEGIIGKVVDVGDNWSKVTSLIDELSSVSFKVIRTQDGGVLSGSVDSVLEGYLFDFEADVIVGDKLYTSGLGGVYKKDVYIGEVTEISTSQEELTKTIVIKPAVDFKKLYNVFVIVN